MMRRLPARGDLSLDLDDAHGWQAWSTRMYQRRER
jgi:hypothetical protein